MVTDYIILKYLYALITIYWLTNDKSHLRLDIGRKYKDWFSFFIKVFLLKYLHGRKVDSKWKSNMYRVPVCLSPYNTYSNIFSTIWYDHFLFWLAIFCSLCLWEKKNSDDYLYSFTFIKSTAKATFHRLSQAKRQHITYSAFGHHFSHYILKSMPGKGLDS